MLQLACYNPEIDWRVEEVKMMRYLEKCGKQWRPKKEKLGQQKQKEEEKREEAGKRQEEKEERKKQNKKPKKKWRIEIRKVAEEWEIWNKKEKMAKSEVEARKLVPERLYKQIYIFEKKVSE